MFENLRKEQFIHSNFPYCNYSLDYTLDSLQRLGATTIEFYGAAPHFCMEDISYGDMKVLDMKLKKHHLQVSEINPENCAYPVNLASRNPATRTRSLRYYKNAIHTAGIIGAKYVLVFPGFPNMDDCVEDVWKISVDSMNILGNIAKTEGINITFEATTSNITVVTDHKKIMQMIKDTGCDNMAATIDLMCLAQTNETVQEIYDICGAERVANVHYTDGGLLPGGCWEHRVPGEGEIDLDTMLQMFDDNHYKGYFGNEVKWSIDPLVSTPEQVSTKLQQWWDRHFQ